jgi:hypothetical protein
MFLADHDSEDLSPLQQAVPVEQVLQMEQFDMFTVDFAWLSRTTIMAGACFFKPAKKY